MVADTTLRLGLFFGMESRFWLNLQSEYDIRMAERETKAIIGERPARPSGRRVQRSAGGLISSTGSSVS